MAAAISIWYRLIQIQAYQNPPDCFVFVPLTHVTVAGNKDYNPFFYIHKRAERFFNIFASWLIVHSWVSRIKCLRFLILKTSVKYSLLYV